MFDICIRDVFSILRGHSIGHSKQKKTNIYIYPILNGFRDRTAQFQNIL
jgi:hypothetical protein